MSESGTATSESLPRSWCAAPLLDVADINPTNPACVPSDDALVSFIPMAAVEAMTGQIELSERRIWKDVRKGYTRFQDGDVLVAKITPCMENGKIAVARHLHGGVGAGSTEFHVLRPTAALSADLLRFYVLQEDFRKAARAKMTGTAGQLRVPGSFLEAHSLWVPPLPEQHRIVEAIESYFTRLDDAVATLERVQRNLKRYRASVLKAAVEGRLVPTEAELARAEGRDYQPASVLLERILTERRRRWEASGRKGKYQDPVAPDTSELPDLREGWCWATVDQLAGHAPNSLTDGPFGSNLRTAHYTDTGPRVVRLQNIGDGVFLDARAHVSQSHYEGLAKHAVQAGDVVVASLGEVLPRACLIPDGLGPAIVKADCLRFAVHSPLALGAFVAHALNSAPTRERTEALVHGLGRPRIGLTLFRQLPIPLPPHSEQQRIVAEIDLLLSLGSAAAEAAGANHRRCQRLRQSILKWAFEGRLADQDPNDEPASALLARIGAEREAARSIPRKNGRRGRRAKVTA